eukprot:CFRG0066T1
MVSDLQARLEKYYPSSIEPMKTDCEHLGEGDNAALRLLVQAAHLIDEIFMLQTWGDSATWKKKLTDAGQSDLLRYIDINMGPWDRLNEDEAFVDGVSAKPEGVEFYPKDMSKLEFEEWVNTLSTEDRDRAKGYYTIIRRDANTRALKLVDYNEEYRSLLQPAADLLRQAGKLVSNEKLAKFLTLRAKSFETNEYIDSECAWLDVPTDSPIEVTIGPYEVYEDALYGYKAAFEAYISVCDAEGTLKIKSFSDRMSELEANLPIKQEYKNPALTGVQPIVVVNQIYCGGDRGGAQTAAYNLPNHEKVIAMKGSKMIILKNVQRRKFNRILMPVADVVIAHDQLEYVTFEAFFTHILAHEMCHGLGPHSITLGDGTKTTVSQQLQNLHSAIEECKADVAGIWALQYLMDHGYVDTALEKSFYVTFLVGAFRSIRFGLNEAHGKGQALQLIYMLRNGGFVYDDATMKFSVNFDKVKQNFTDLARLIMETQAVGDQAGAQAMVNEYAVLSPPVQKALQNITDMGIPVDIEPVRLL